MVVSACLRLLLLSACLRAGRLEKADALEAHDILDLGASKNAHSAVFFEALQGQLPAGGRALRMATLDSNPEKVASCNATARSEQHTCLTADVTSLARSSRTCSSSSSKSAARVARDARRSTDDGS